MGLLGKVLGTDQQKAALDRAGTLSTEAQQRSQASLQNYLAQALSTLRPYNQAGQDVLPQLMGVAGERVSPTATGFSMENFFNDPSFQFRQQKGEGAINRASTARGNFFTPETLQELMGFNQGLASEEYGNAFQRYLSQAQTLFGQQMGSQEQLYNQLAQIYGIGANAGGQIAGAQLGTGQQIAGGQMQLGSDLSNLAIARGNVNPMNRLLDLAGQGAGAYFSGGGTMAKPKPAAV